MSKSDLIDISVQLHAETEKAFLISDDGDEKKAKWLPKSQCEENSRKGNILQIALPEWLALEKKLI